MGKIVWLAAYPKSGNTWLRVFLHNYILDGAAPHDINRLTELSASECNAAFFAPHDPRPAAAYTPQEVQTMRPAVHRDLTRLHDDLVFIKTHNAALEMHGVPLCSWDVTAGAIYLVRDPRDVVVSYSAYTGRGLDAIIEFLGSAGAANRGSDAQVFEWLNTWSAHVASWTARPNTLVLRYEDLVAAPQAGFRRVIGFLGSGAVEPDRLSRAIARSDFATLAAQEQLHGYVAGGPNPASPFFRKGTVGQWRDVLSREQVQRIETAHVAMMRRFGYQATASSGSAAPIR